MLTDESLLSDLLVAAHRLTRIAAQDLGSTTPSAVWNTLSILTTDGPLRVGELATAARVTQPSMTRVVHELIADGYALKDADATDLRASVISVTPAGITALSDWRHALASTLQPMFAGMTGADRTAVARTVDILSARTATEQARA